MRSVEFLMDFHNEVPENPEIDQIINFLYDLKEEKGRNWRTIKIYVAGLRRYYQLMPDDVDTASLIPYPKEENTLPKIISREELTDLFIACRNPKHRVMFRLNVKHTKRKVMQKILISVLKKQALTLKKRFTKACNRKKQKIETAQQ